MLQRQFSVSIGMALTVLFLCSPVNAADDKEQADIVLADITDSADRWALDSNGKLFSYTLRIYKATAGLTLNGHVRTAGSSTTPAQPENVAHRHCFTDDMKSEYSDTTTPKKSENNAYWHARFTKCDFKGGDTITHTCHEYALDNSTRATGTYNYVFDNVGYVLGKDMKNLGAKSGQVREQDVLSYPGHSTIVLSANANKPSKLRWKWQGSGIYEYH